MSVGRPRRLLTKLALSAASLMAVLLAVELGMRAWLAARGHAWDAQALEGELVRRISSLRTRLPTLDPRSVPRETADATEVLHPYLGYDGIGMRAQILREIEGSRRERGFDVFVTGGSVSAIFVGAGSNRMLELLRQAPEFADGAARVWLEGRGAYKQPQPANALAYALSLGVEPELVILIDGFNDVAISGENVEEGTHPLYPWASNWLVLASNPIADPRMLDRMVVLRSRQERVTEFGDLALDLGLVHSALAGSLALRHMRSMQAGVGAAMDDLTKAFAEFRRGPVERGPTFRGDVEQGRLRAIEAWFQGSLSMWSVCRARGIRFLHVLQPTLHDEGSKPLTDSERANGTAEQSWIDGARLGYPRLRAAGAELAQRGVPFLDASQIFADVTETLYYDNCHFDDAGNRLLGEAIGRRLLEDAAERGK